MIIYICPHCGNKLKNITKVGDIFDKYYCDWCEEEIDEDDVSLSDDENFDDDRDVPRGCQACGGPYPHCKSSCNVFDD